MSVKHYIHADNAQCRDCQACTLICSLSHEGVCSPSLARLSVTKDMARYEFRITVCHNCAKPDCLDACPSEAMHLDEGGVVILDEAACSQCGSCAAGCPYGAIFSHEATGRYLKCDYCAGRPEGPLCVAICPVGALVTATASQVAEAVP